MQNVLASLKRLFRRKRLNVVVTGVAGELIRPGQFFIIVEGKAYPVSPQRLTQPIKPK
jgi:hypothetical protein